MRKEILLAILVITATMLTTLYFLYRDQSSQTVSGLLKETPRKNPEQNIPELQNKKIPRKIKKTAIQF